jgi:hypothetical protein
VRAFLIAGVVVLALAGCSHAATPVSVSTPPPTAAASATPDPLANLDSTLSTADGAVNQSRSDLSSGDASAAKNDDQ